MKDVLTTTYLLRVAQAMCDSAYWEDIGPDLIANGITGEWDEVSGSCKGQEIYRAYAAMFARISQAVYNTLSQHLILLALSQQAGTGTITIRVIPAIQPIGVTLMPGSSFKTASGNIIYLLEKITFGKGVQSASGTYAVLLKDFQGGCRANEDMEFETVIFESGSLYDPADVDELLEFVSNTESSQSNLDYLRQLAYERGLDRFEGEDDDRFRTRLRKLPDVITPAAIERVVNEILYPYSEKCDILTHQQYGIALYARRSIGGSGGGPTEVGTYYCYYVNDYYPGTYYWAGLYDCYYGYSYVGGSGGGVNYLQDTEAPLWPNDGGASYNLQSVNYRNHLNVPLSKLWMRAAFTIMFPELLVEVESDMIQPSAYRSATLSGLSGRQYAAVLSGKGFDSILTGNLASYIGARGKTYLADTAYIRRNAVYANIMATVDKIKAAGVKFRIQHKVEA